jgi:hypothetical protein
MKYGTVIEQLGLSQKWKVGNELVAVSNAKVGSTVWHFPKTDDRNGIIYRITHNQYLYVHPDGRLFEAWAFQ